MDPHSGTFRFTYGSLTFKDGLGIVPIVMGLFGISEGITNVEEKMDLMTLIAQVNM